MTYPPRSLWQWILVGLVLVGTPILLALTLAGCCGTCPKPPTTVVAVERPCQLPPPIQLAAVPRDKTCPADRVCFTIPAAGQLAKNLANLKDWIREVRARCGPKPASAPASKPVTP